MLAYRKAAIVAASTFALSAAFALPAAAQTTGTSSGHTGQDVSVMTCGQGSTDGTSVQVSGCADAEARNGGTVATDTRAQTNERRAMQRSTATARDEDERARSRTMTRVRNGEVVSSRSSTWYKQRGQRPVRETQRSTARQSGTTTTTTPH